MLTEKYCFWELQQLKKILKIRILRRAVRPGLLLSTKWAEELGHSPDIVSYDAKELVKRKYETECPIAAKYNNSKMLEAKWKPVRDCNSLGT